MGVTLSQLDSGPKRNRALKLGTVHLGPTGPDIGFCIVWQSGDLEIQLDGDLPCPLSLWIDVVNPACLPAFKTSDLVSQSANGSQKIELRQAVLAMRKAHARVFVTTHKGQTKQMEIFDELS